MADKTFDNLNPPTTVTNPGGLPGFQEYPRHMHKHHEPSVQVPDEAGRDEKLKAGYFLTPLEAEQAWQAAQDAEDAGDAPKKKADKKKAQPKS